MPAHAEKEKECALYVVQTKFKFSVHIICSSYSEYSILKMKAKANLNKFFI